MLQIVTSFSQICEIKDKNASEKSQTEIKFIPFVDVYLLQEPGLQM